MAAPGKKASWLARLSAGLSKTSSRLSGGLDDLLKKRKLDAAALDELEDLLIEADLGAKMAARITGALRKGKFDQDISPEDVRRVLAAEVESVLQPVARGLSIARGRKPHVVLVVGVNGTGKTTTIGKLAAGFARDGHNILLVAGDTFRAAAVEQLRVWGERAGAHVIAGAAGAEPAGLAYDALKEARARSCDIMICDTAGRLQNKTALMGELEKVIRVIRKVDETAPHDVVLVLDATTGQNALGQVEAFRDSAGVTGLIMTKLDGTAKGGILVAIADRFGLPIHAIGVGEGIEDLRPFDAGEFARALTKH